MRYELAFFIGFVAVVCFLQQQKSAINVLTIIITFAVESEQGNASRCLLTVSTSLHDIKSQFGFP